MADWDVVSETPIGAPPAPQKPAPGLTVEAAPPPPSAPAETGGNPVEVKSNNFAGMRIPGATSAGGPASNPSGWAHFATPEDGLKGISYQLDRYAQGKTTGKPITTLRGIVSTWAPPSENDTGGLIARAVKVTGFGPDQPLDVSDPKVKAKLIEAMIRGEQGGKLPVSTDLIVKVAGAPSDSSWSVTQNGKWRVSPDSIASAQGKPNSNLVWMSPDDYLAMTPETAAPRRHSLRKMLEQGDEIQDIPTLDVETKGERAKITDQDGRQRALVAKEEGVDLIPVSIQGISGQAPAWIEGMRGTIRPFNFTPVPKVEKPPPTPLDKSQFPYDQPGVTYGNILPFAKDDKSGRIDFALPEMIRSIVRGAISGGERATGTGQTVE